MSNGDEIYNFADDARFDEDPNASIIKVIGVGGGGSNAVNYMYGQNIPNVNFVVCNTDKQHLNEMAIPTKLLLGWEVTHYEEQEIIRMSGGNVLKRAARR